MMPAENKEELIKMLQQKVKLNEEIISNLKEFFGNKKSVLNQFLIKLMH